MPGSVHPVDPGQMAGGLMEVCPWIRRIIHRLAFDEFHHQIGRGKQAAGGVQGIRLGNGQSGGAEDAQEAVLVGGNPGIPPKIPSSVLAEEQLFPAAVRPFRLQKRRPGRHAPRKLLEGKQPAERIDFPDHLCEGLILLKNGHEKTPPFR